ncbi:MAG: IS3 family transposase [Acutalibacteraceae bacterium]
MPKSYRYIKMNEKDILKRKAQGYTRKEIGDRFGLNAEQTHDFTKRYNRKQYIHFYNNERIQIKTKLTPMEYRNQFAGQS